LEISPSVHLIKNIFVNQFLIIGKDGLLLVDTGIGGNQNHILNTIKGLGFQTTDLKQIVITHADGDHYGSLAALEKVVQAVTYAQPIEIKAIQSGGSSRVLKPEGFQKLFFSMVRPMMKTQPAAIECPLSGGEVFDYLGGLQVILTPGHTPGHISLFAEDKRILFAGDSIQVVNGSPRPSAKGNTWDMARAEESFQKQMDLKPSVILAGHGIWIK
jgi:glyoxylase-like metal-dependent hydrolase (beta-lactamase superfamily II)